MTVIDTRPIEAFTGGPHWLGAAARDVEPRQGRAMEERHGVRGHIEAGGLVSVLGGFEWRRAGVTLPTTPAGQRLIAFLAVRHRPIARGTVAGILWPGSEEHTSELQSH